jgi:hypothetical protein
MKWLAIGIGSLCIVGCSSADGQAKTDAQKVDDRGSWQIVPVQGPPIQDHGEYYWSAWRINTRTGDTEFCTFDSGDPNPSPTTTHPNAGGITCSSASQPQ